MMNVAINNSYYTSVTRVYGRAARVQECGFVFQFICSSVDVALTQIIQRWGTGCQWIINGKYCGRKSWHMLTQYPAFIHTEQWNPWTCTVRTLTRCSGWGYSQNLTASNKLWHCTVCPVRHIRATERIFPRCLTDWTTDNIVKDYCGVLRYIFAI
jgi:hypothetical protein